MSVIIAVISGLLSGVLSGMGIGGGTVLIPALSLFLSASQQTAQGVNLLYFIPTAAIALCVHIKNKTVNLRLALPIVVLGALGAVCGSFLALRLEHKALKKLFGLFLFFMGIYEIRKKPQK